MGCSAKKNPIEKSPGKDTAREEFLCATIFREYQVQIQFHNPPPNFAEAGFSVFQRCLFGLVTIFPLQRGPIGQIST